MFKNKEGEGKREERKEIRTPTPVKQRIDSRRVKSNNVAYAVQTDFQSRLFKLKSSLPGFATAPSWPFLFSCLEGTGKGEGPS